MVNQILYNMVFLFTHNLLVLEKTVEELLELSASLFKEILWLGPEWLLGRELGQLIVYLHRESLFQDRLEITHRTVSIPDVERKTSRGYHLNQVLNIPVSRGFIFDELDLIVIR